VSISYLLLIGVMRYDKILIERTKDINKEEDLSLKKEDVEHIAQLSRIEFTDEKKEKFTEEISAILDYVDELETAPTENVETISQISGLKNIARIDEVAESLPNEKVLLNAPEKHDGFIKVRKVFENV